VWGRLAVGVVVGPAGGYGLAVQGLGSAARLVVDTCLWENAKVRFF
jgi:hypothetical protein